MLLFIASLYKWSRVRPISHVSGGHPVARAWMGAAIESPITMHALIYAMLRTILLTGRGSGVETMLAYRHYASCLVHLRTEIERIEIGSAPVTDNLILGVAALSAHGEPRDGTLQATASEIPVSPLAMTQNLNVYGMSMQAEHMQAVYLLVNLKGGLHNIALDGLPDVLEVYALVGHLITTHASSLTAAVWISVSLPGHLRHRNSTGATLDVLPI